MDLLSAIVTLFLIMDPIGNVPVFLAYLRNVEERRRTYVVARESLIALVILMFFLFFGASLARTLRIEPPALHISGGVLLFLISLGMIFPELTHIASTPEQPQQAEPFIVPLATPLLAGPSSMATIMLFISKEPQRLWHWLTALIIAWVITALILMASPRLSRVLGQRGLVACERLMGMILTVVAVQMFLDGIKMFAASLAGGESS